jgi:hypothetical protein
MTTQIADMLRLAAVDETGDVQIILLVRRPAVAFVVQTRLEFPPQTRDGASRACVTMKKAKDERKKA